jgi:hypothetical protein
MFGKKVCTPEASKLSSFGCAGDESLLAYSILTGDEFHGALDRDSLIWAMGYYDGRGNEEKAAHIRKRLKSFPRP